MKERPILFSAPMIRAILDGRKTQTRRLVRWPVLGPSVRGKRRVYTPIDVDAEREAIVERCPYGKPGDVLRVRETWATYKDANGRMGVTFFADGARVQIDNTPAAALQWLAAHDNGKHKGKWRPSIFLPTWASRIRLTIVERRIERLQAITEEDARAEGVTPLTGLHDDQRIISPDPWEERRTHGTHPYTLAFAVLWDEINHARAPWIDDRWVWAVTFAPVRKGRP